MGLQEKIWDDNNLIKLLKNGGVAIMPTDTIYGMTGKAHSETVVNRVYSIRKRDPNKPFIILIGDVDEIKKFSINISEEERNVLNKYWPGPVSIILDCPSDFLEYLHRGTKTLAFRVPKPQALRDLLLGTGPLIAPSANTEKFPASENIKDAQRYFGDLVDLYMDGGSVTSKASKIIKFHKNGSVSIIMK